MCDLFCCSLSFFQGKRGKVVDSVANVTQVDPAYFRPTEVDFLQGDCSKAKRVLGWQVKTSFKSLVKMMVDHDLQLAKNEKLIHDNSTAKN
jgi:GDPmannose 4,6-dehydratase